MTVNLHVPLTGTVRIYVEASFNIHNANLAVNEDLNIKQA